MKRLLRAIVVFAALLAVVPVSLLTWLNITAVAAGDLPQLRNGDIVFQDSGGAQGVAIMFASRSLYTHTGLIEIAQDGTALVVEAVGPVRTIPLDRWIARGRGKRITIKRVRNLDEPNAKAVIARAHHYDGYPYDIFFYESRDAIYCSELVYAAFIEAIGISVEKLRDLHIDNVAVRKLIQSRWQKHPLCQSNATTTFDSCYALVLEQTLVTPASIARDPQMELVYSNFGVVGD
jgi:hypothetical protein